MTDIRQPAYDDVYKICFLINSEPKALIPVAADEIIESIEGKGSRKSIAAYVNGDLAGYASVLAIGDRFPELRSLVVARPYRGLGVSEELIDHGIDIAREDGHQGLFSYVRLNGQPIENSPAYRTFVSKGFRMNEYNGDSSKVMLVLRF